MKYQGSKRKFIKDFLPILLENRVSNQYYVEPFCGSASLIGAIENPRIASDINPYLIGLLKAIQSGWIPPDNISEEEYRDTRLNKEKYPDYWVGYIGFQMSFGGKWFGGYRRDSIGKRNYSLESKRDILKQAPTLQGIQFHCCPYNQLDIPPKSILLLDPPYADTTKYKDGIDYPKFYQWCRDKKEEGHTLFVCEYNMPEDFVEVWSKKVVSSLTQDTGAKTAMERLWTLK